MQIWLWASVAVAAFAAAWDYRTGTIPNWLTLTPLAATPLLRGWVEGWFGLGSSLFGILLCGLVPLVMFRYRAMGGGDVKLFAALGAILGPFAGLEAQFFSLLVAGLFASARLTYHGQLLRTVRNTVTFVWTALLSGSAGTANDSQLTQKVRLGPSALVGVLMTISGYGLSPW